MFILIMNVIFNNKDSKIQFKIAKFLIALVLIIFFISVNLNKMNNILFKIHNKKYFYYKINIKKY